MNTTEQVSLARKLGQPAHVSPLLKRIIRVSGCSSQQAGEWLFKSAVERGAHHYQREFPPTLPPDQASISDEEIGVALCLGEHPFNSIFIRAAAQLLSSRDVDPGRLARLAVQERVELVLLHIARSAEGIVPETQPWIYLREHLRLRQAADAEALPHWSRFVSQTGVTVHGGPPEIHWLCSRRRKP